MPIDVSLIGTACATLGTVVGVVFGAGVKWGAYSQKLKTEREKLTKLEAEYAAYRIEVRNREMQTHTVLAQLTRKAKRRNDLTSEVPILRSFIEREEDSGIIDLARLIQPAEAPPRLPPRLPPLLPPKKKP